MVFFTFPANSILILLKSHLIRLFEKLSFIASIQIHNFELFVQNKLEKWKISSFLI
jgi:hypothetical protein